MSRSLPLVSGLSLLALLWAPAVHALTFTDWTSVDLNGNVAQGSMGPIAVTLSGGDLVFAITDGSSTAYDDPTYCPPLATADYLEFRGTPLAPTYTVSFGRLVHNPVLHIGSLGSTLTFSGVTLTKLCGQASLAVTGNQVIGPDCIGGGPPPIDSDHNGTIRVNGWVSSLTFTAAFDPGAPGCSSASEDGISIQIGADTVETPALSRWGSLVLLLMMGLLGSVVLARSRRRTASA